jgi:hypothetical protein
MGLGRGKTEHDGPRDMARKAGHWGFTEEAKESATRARRRDEKELLRREAQAAGDASDESADRRARRMPEEGLEPPTRGS